MIRRSVAQKNHIFTWSGQISKLNTLSAGLIMLPLWQQSSNVFILFVLYDNKER